MKEEKKLYKVKSVNQETGKEMITYVSALNLQKVEDEFADILLVEPLTPFEDLEDI